MIAPSLAYAARNTPPWIGVAERWVFVPLAAVMIAAGVLAAKRYALPAVLPIGTLALSLLILTAAHAIGGVLYPWSRTGLPLVWLFLVSCLFLWEWASREQGWPRWLSPLSGAVAVLLAAASIIQFDTRYYYDFRHDAEVGVMMRRLRDRHPLEPACVGGSWYFEPTVNYCRLRYRLQWLEEMKRTSGPQAGVASSS